MPEEKKGKRGGKRACSRDAKPWGKGVKGKTDVSIFWAELPGEGEGRKKKRGVLTHRQPKGGGGGRGRRKGPFPTPTHQRKRGGILLTTRKKVKEGPGGLRLPRIPPISRKEGGEKKRREKFATTIPDNSRRGKGGRLRRCYSLSVSVSGKGGEKQLPYFSSTNRKGEKGEIH